MLLYNTKEHLQMKYVVIQHKGNTLMKYVVIQHKVRDTQVKYNNVL